jgi:translocation protein SEC62
MEHQAKAPPEFRNVAKFLRGYKELKIKPGVLNGKRIDYFKGRVQFELRYPLLILLIGKSAVKALLSPAYAKLKKVPPQPKSEDEAAQLLLRMIPFAFFLRIERGAPSGSPSSPKHVQIVQQQTFQPDLYFAWFYDGPQWTTYLGGAIMVAVILGGVMYPLWPAFMRLGAYYMSLLFFALIGLFFAIAIVRLIFYIVSVIVASPGIWIFPKLFADVGFVCFTTLIPQPTAMG